MKIRTRMIAAALLTGAVWLASCTAQAQTSGPAQRAANDAIARWPDGQFTGRKQAWNYELGTLLEGMDALWLNTTDVHYYKYIKSSVDPLITKNGSIKTWQPNKYRLDDILLGRQLLLLYGVTLQPRYAKAASRLYEQLQHQPRNAEGGFWHKQRYPNQMWLDGLYMAEPFYAEYAATFHHPDAFRDITHQFVLLRDHARNPETGLLYHGWDASKKERWANPHTGLSSQFWARGMGWYMMALVDTLPYYPDSAPGKKELLTQLRQAAAAITHYQDRSSGLWYEVLDRPREKGNFAEASASSMFVYALAKGVRLGYLPARYMRNAQRGYHGILRRFLHAAPDGHITLSGTVAGAGLGGHPYRDGSYQYYIHEKRATNDPKGIGAFLLASAEMEHAADTGVGRGKVVLLDAWFNSQKRTDAFGRLVYFHYKWKDRADSGYSFLGHIFRSYGAATRTLYTAPTAEALQKTQVYLIVSPDVPARNPHPNYMTSKDADVIAQWVKRGGVLMLMENDPANADIKHFNLLAELFGIHYNAVLRNAVKGDQLEMGTIAIHGGGPIFRHDHTVYMKEICTITAKAPAKPVLTHNGEVVMAVARYGKGTVFANVDPWLYNEYTDGQKLPPRFSNFGAGKELVRWVLQQVPRDAKK